MSVRPTGTVGQVIFEDRTALEEHFEPLHEDLSEFDVYRNKKLCHLVAYGPIFGIGCTMFSIILKSVNESLSTTIEDILPSDPFKLFLLADENKMIKFKQYIMACLINGSVFLMPEVSRSQAFEDHFKNNLRKIIVELLKLDIFKYDNADEILNNLYSNILEYSSKYYSEMLFFERPFEKFKDRVAVISHDAGFGHRVTAEAVVSYLAERDFNVFYVHFSTQAPVKDELEKVSIRIAEFSPSIIFSTAYDRRWSRVISNLSRTPVVDIMTDYNVSFFESEERQRFGFSSDGEFQPEGLERILAVPTNIEEETYLEDVNPDYAASLKYMVKNDGVFVAPKIEKYFLGFPTRKDPLFFTYRQILETRRNIFKITNPEVLENPKIPVCTVLYSSCGKQKDVIQKCKTLGLDKEKVLPFLDIMQSPILSVLNSLKSNINSVAFRIHVHVIFGREEGEKGEFEKSIRKLECSEEMKNVSFSTSGFTHHMTEALAASQLVISVPSGATSAEILQQRNLRVIWAKPSKGNMLMQNIATAILFEKHKIGMIYNEERNIYEQIYEALKDRTSIPQMEIPDWKEKFNILLMKRGLLSDERTYAV